MSAVYLWEYAHQTYYSLAYDRAAGNIIVLQKSTEFWPFNKFKAILNKKMV